MLGYFGLVILNERSILIRCHMPDSTVEETVCSVLRSGCRVEKHRALFSVLRNLTSVDSRQKPAGMTREGEGFSLPACDRQEQATQERYLVKGILLRYYTTGADFWR